MNNKRYEIKFVIPYEQVGDVMQWLYSENKLTISLPIFALDLDFYFKLHRFDTHIDFIEQNKFN